LENSITPSRLFNDLIIDEMEEKSSDERESFDDEEGERERGRSGSGEEEEIKVVVRVMNEQRI
jgi:hypothetical protein